ncbi:hypothetical protein FBR02_06480 [Anaerolineae bacterium CFX9]|jgi:hypothetical protein|nr:hypothetical protein [Kamptonema cortianum]MDL1900399.1 hypothetical protein [Anaerolineae bacterium CFX9]
MSVASAHLNVASTAHAPAAKQSLWLRSRRWDLFFISLSVFLVPLPYLFYLAGVHFGIDPDVSRNVVNGFVAVAIGGPHMMSTFLRTGLDKDFNKRYPMLIRSSVIIPIIVVALAFLNLNLLLTVFFFWAATHVLHQVTYIVELYRHKETRFVRPSAVTLPSRLIDYAVIMTCLFPFAALKISQGQFEVGQNDLTSVIPQFFQQLWFFYLMTGVFLVSVALFIGKTYREYRLGIVNWPKTIFILLTVAVAFTIPSLPNLDTAFQGMNTWHSFQYLAITFYIIRIRQEYGDLRESAPLVARFQKAKGTPGLFLLSTMMLIGSVIVFAIVYAVAPFVRPDINPNQHFDIAYYTAILSFLWIHYYHDHFLFTNFEALDQAYGDAKA